MLQPFDVADATRRWFRRYVRSGFPLRDPELDSQRERLIDSGLLWTEPFVKLERTGTGGPNLSGLSSILDPETLAVPWGFERLYDHQARAIERLVARPGNEPENTLVLSGTGSGKTEGFLIPIVDACLRDPKPGIRAVIVYPMNALANDQLNRLRRLLISQPEITFGRYTGDAPERDEGDGRCAPRPDGAPPNLLWSREQMRAQPPSILLTNYTMLEYLLLRGKDAELFQHGPPQYLVVDEIHLFTGVLGAEVGALLRRFRQHVAGTDGRMCMVGTSATAGSEAEQHQLLEFAERFFGARFSSDSAIAETPMPLPPRGTRIPPAPEITPDLLAAAHDYAGLAALAHATFGVDLPTDERLRVALGQVIDEYATVGIVEQALIHPAALEDAARELRQLSERQGSARDEVVREAQAVVLLGAAARVTAIGEEEPQPRFRPRVHQVLRTLAGLWRCLDPEHGVLEGPQGNQCSCGALTLPLATCRTCGEAYWTSPSPTRELGSLSRVQPVEYARGEPAVFLTERDRIVGPVDEDEEGHRVHWDEARVCASCGAFALNGRDLDHLRWCPKPSGEGAAVLASTDDVHCPGCGDLGARTRPILLPLKGSAAASVAVLTQGLSDELRAREGEPGGRLLVFADSRQDAAQQAGYADDQGARIAVRQLIDSALEKHGPTSLKSMASIVQPLVVDDPAPLRRWLVGESERNFGELSDPDYVPSPEDRRQIELQLSWEVALEFTERARRRFSLEQEGLITVEVDGLDELTEKLASTWPTCPFPEPQLKAVIQAVVDVMRSGRAVSHSLLRRTPRELRRNHQIRIGDRAVLQTRGYAKKPHRSPRDGIDIRAWTRPKHATRMTELVGRVLERPAIEVNDVVETLAERLGAVGLLTESTAGGRKRSMVDVARIVVSRRDGEALWRCDRCGNVRSSLLTCTDGRPQCVNWRCSGTPRSYEPPPERDFYRGQYLAPPRRLIVREHSAQVEGDARIALENSFNDRDHPVVDALACTPTLEVGVSLDDLHSVVLRNLPPTPANYAQRVGRAGRRSRVALAVAHAGHGPHDTYFFANPEELIAGDVRAPAISLDNAPLLRRHVNSLVLETLRIDLPVKWVPLSDDDDDPTVADEDGVVRESTLAPFEESLAKADTKAALQAAVRGAFASPSDPSPPREADEIALNQVEEFTDDLRRALKRWCDRYRALVEEYRQTMKTKGVPTKDEQEEQGRLLREIERLRASSTPDYQPLGFLGLVGFLPRYGFTGDSVLLHPDGSDQPIAQSALVAVTEFAPGNLVYARGRRLKVARLDPPPVDEGEAGSEFRANVVTRALRCDRCEHVTRDPLEKACPHCGADLVSQTVLALSGVRAGGGAISTEDEYRRRSAYIVRHFLGTPPEPGEQVTLGGYGIERFHGREISIANVGLRVPDAHDTAHGFELCSGCGYAAELHESIDEDELPEEEQVGHRAFCPARKDPRSPLVKRGVWLTARMRGDVLELELPPATHGEEFRSWRETLAEALLLGIRETMQAGRRDLDWFERRRNGRPIALVFYDTMPGGTGYFPKLFTDGAKGFKAAALLASERLDSCTCVSSCHRCLRDFWNQRLHGRLNRFEAIGPLRRLAEAEPIAGLPAENEQLESFLEREFFERLAAAGIPEPTLQVYRQVGSRLITVVDCEYRDPDVSIFLDGRTYHAQSREKIEDDLDRRNQLEARGVCVMEFTYQDVMSDFNQVASQIAAARAGGSPESVALRDLPGLELQEQDDTTRTAVVLVRSNDWQNSEDERGQSLHSANVARLAGWRLHRVISER